MSADTKPAERPAAKPPRETKSRAGWLAALFVLALAGWMGSGYYYPAAAPLSDAPGGRTREPMLVEVTASVAESVTEFVTAEGQVVPDRLTPVRAKVGGTVESIAVAKGDFLEEGALIARIALADRAAQQAQAEAELARRQGEYDRLSGLAEKGYATLAQIEEARALLATAQAAVAVIGQTTGDTEVRAPITGILDRFDLDLGEFVAESAEVGTQIDIDPLIVEVQIAQQSVARIRDGQTARVNFITGETREGTVRYIASNATPETRTFPVEIEVPNPNRDIPSGISAQVQLPVGETPAHFLSAALLALGTDGTLGVKAVDPGNAVRFHPIELVRAETAGIWVAGLPEEVDLISVGQGFVSDGETVRVIEAAPDGEGAPSVAAPARPDAAPIASDGAAPAVETAALARADAAVTVEVSAAADAAGEWTIRAMQQRLASLGYEPGPVDGVLGASTRDAIRSFQRDQGIAITGEADADLATALLQIPAAGR